MSHPDLLRHDRLEDAPLRLAEPGDVDPDATPYMSLWRRTDDDPDPVSSPVFEAYEAFADAVDGFEDAFWTALHWATGEVPTSAAVPAPPGETRRVFVWRDRELLAVSASPEKGIRPQFPPSMDAERRVAYLRWFTRVTRRLKASDLGDVFREPVIDYRTRVWVDELKTRLGSEDEPVGAICVFYTVEPTET